MAASLSEAFFAGVISHTGAQGLLYGVGIAPGPVAGAVVRGGLADLSAALGPWFAPRAFPNFAGRRCPPAVVFGEEAAPRLAAVRAEGDPEGIFRATHPITA